MFIFLIYISLTILALVFLLYPVFYADEEHVSQEEVNKQDEETINIKDKIQSLQASLKDIHLENQIGKLSDKDFKLLKVELLREWSEYEKKLPHPRSK